MQEQMDPIEQPDRFSDYLRQRLEDHRMPVEANGWEDINARLGRRTLLRKRLLAAGLLVAAVWTGMVWLIRPVDPPLPQDIPVQSVVTPSLPQQPSLPPAVEDDKPALTAPVSSAPSRVLAVAPRRVETTPIIDSTALIVAEEIEEGKEEEKKDVTDAQPVEKASRQTSGQTDERGEVTVPVDANGRWTVNGDHVPAKRRTTASGRSSWLVAAGMGTGSNVSLSLSEYDGVQDDPLNEYAGVAPGWFTHDKGWNNLDNSTALSTFSPDYYRDVTYHLPLSFSLLARKNLTSRLAVESGLVYTYLHNSYRAHQSLLMKGDYQAHYLGIPLNGVVYLVNRSRWDVYLSVGVMAERSFSAFYTSTGYNNGWIASLSNGEVVSQTYHPSIKGLQWSINSSLGVSYRILRDWSLYAEPRFSYYFDNNQPQTIRTEHPVTLGIGAGIRYEF